MLLRFTFEISPKLGAFQEFITEKLMTEWRHWPSLPLAERHNLPSKPGIYVIVDAEGEVWYVGLSVNIKSRWHGKGHHRYRQLSCSNNKRGYRIYWQIFPVEQLAQKEQYYIELFRPFLNYTRVQTYARKALQPDQELKRIFKILNKKTLLFPDFRSVVLGFYRELEEDETETLKEYTCIVTAISVKDHDSTIVKSFNKSVSKKGGNLRGCWRYYETTCGDTNPEANQIDIPCFITDELVYEFICPLVLNNQIEQYKDRLCSVTLVDQPVLALKDMDILPTLLASEKPKFLHDKYLDFRALDLLPITELLMGSTA